MTEKIVVFNAYGASNQRGQELAHWLKNLNPDVSLISELGVLSNVLKQVGTVVADNGDNNHDVGAVVTKATIDDRTVVKLTDFIHRDNLPMLWRDRWYVRVRVNKQVYYSIHANAAIGDDHWADSQGARAWRRAMGVLKGAIKRDMADGYAVRVGGDFNFLKANVGDSPNDMFDSLGLNYMNDRFMWLAWDPKYDKVVDRKVLGIAPGADAHNVLTLTLERKASAPAPKPQNHNATLNIVTSNLKTDRTPAQVKEDAKWIVDNFKPDIWGTQEAKNHIGVLRDLAKYQVALPSGATDAEKNNAILFNSDVLRLVGRYETKAPGGRYINTVHLQHRATGQSIYYLNTQFVWGDPTTHDHVKLFGEMVSNKAGGDNIVFWGGDFDVDEDKTNLNTLINAGLLSAYDELKTPDSFDTFNKKKADVLGSHKKDANTAAKSVSRSPVLNSDHRYVKGVFTFQAAAGNTPDPTAPPPSGTSNGGTSGGSDNGDNPVPGSVGSPTDPGTPDSPATPPPPSEKDRGSDWDHTDCCGGRVA